VHNCPTCGDPVTAVATSPPSPPSPPNSTSPIPWQPAAELLPAARVYRQRVRWPINGKRTLAEARELCVHAAYLSEKLGDHPARNHTNPPPPTSPITSNST
jgi:hypothetical protein